jgi:hypothetical protein
MSIPLTLLDFEILRFKLSKLLKIKEKRISDIHIYSDNTIGVQCRPFGLVKFDSLKEIETDYNTFYPNEVLPKKFTVLPASTLDDGCKSGVLLTKD